MGLEYGAVPSASPRVALPCEDAIRSGEMLIWVSKRGRATRTWLGQDEVFQFGGVVGDAEAMEHGGGVKDTLTHLRMGHRPRGQSIRATSLTVEVEQWVEYVPHRPAEARIKAFFKGSMASKISKSCLKCRACLSMMHSCLQGAKG